MTAARADFEVSAKQTHARRFGQVAFVQAAMIVGLAFYGIFRFGDESSVGAWHAVLYGLAALVGGSLVIGIVLSWLRIVLVRRLANAEPERHVPPSYG